MRYATIALFASIAIAGSAHAQSRHVYDWQSGNSYTITPTYNGGARIDGYNIQNGTMWNQNIDRRGNADGWDSRGNMWNYDARSGTYMNYGTGRMCTGFGAARVCN